MKQLSIIIISILMAMCFLCSCADNTNQKPDNENVTPDNSAELSTHEEDKVNVITDDEVVSLLKAEAELNRYLNYGAMKYGGGTAGSAEYPEKKFYKCGEEDKDEWSEWEAYVRSVYCSEAAESALNSPSIVNIDGFTYSDWDGEPWEYEYTDEFIFTQESSGENTVVFIVTNPSVEQEDGKVNSFTFTYTDNGWRISSVE